MKTHTLLTLAVAVTAAISAAVISTSIGHADAEQKAPTVVAPTDSSVKEKLTDHSFIEKAAQSNMEASMLSKIALEKSSNAKLKKFAQQIVDSSSKSMEKLQAVASENRLAVPTELSDPQQKMVEQMRQLTGINFDQTYADVIQKTQDSRVALYDNAAGEGTLNVNLRVYANKVLPELRKNQELAHALKPTTPEATISNAKTKGEKSKGE